MSQSLNIRLSMSGGAQVTAAIRQVQESVAGMAGKFAAIAGFVGIGAGLAAAVKAGIDFNATLEQARLGIAAIQVQLNPGKFTFDKAMEKASSAIELLKKRAKESPASFEELVQGFQAISGAATSAGIPMGKQIDLVVLMSQALAGLGIRSEQIVQESRALLTGNIDQNAAAARILGITKGDIDAAKEAGTLYEFLTGKLAAFKEAGDRSQGTFSVLISNIKDGLQQAAGAATGSAFVEIEEVLKRIVAIDFESAGRRAGAFVALVIAAWKDGRLPEIIGLTIEAGFEKGVEGAKVVWNALVSFLTQRNVANSIGNAVVTAIAKVAEMLIDLDHAVRSVMTATIIWVFDQIRAGVLNLGNSMLAMVAQVVNFLLTGIETAINKLRGLAGQAPLGLPRVGVTPASVRPGMSFDDALVAGTNATQGGADFKRGMVESLVGAYREFFAIGKGVTDESGKTVSAWERLKQLTGEIIAKVPAIPELLDEETKAVERRINPLIRERELKGQLSDIEDVRRAIDANFHLTAAQKYAAKRLALADEIEKLKELNKLMTEAAALEKDPEKQQGFLNKAEGYRGAIGDRLRERSSQGPDPMSFRDQWSNVMTGLQDQWGSWAQQTAQSFATVFNTAISSISSGITGLIMGTTTWAKALASIGTTILTTVIQSIVQMGVQWIATRLLISAVEKTASAGDAIAKAPSALMTSISSYGVAAAIGAAAVLAAVAAFGGFQQGGYTGNAGTGDVAGVVHGREFVFDAPSVSRIGVGNLEAMRSGGSMSAGVSSGKAQRVIIVDDARTAAELAKDPEFENVIVDLGAKNRWRVRGS